MRRIGVRVAVVLVMLAWGRTAHADLITGEINFLGSWQALDCTQTIILDITQACAVDVTGDTATVFAGATGDFAGLDGQPADVYNDFTFAPTASVPVTPLWSVGGFTFDLLSMTVVTQTSSLLQLTGTGVISHSSYTPTSVDWEFQGTDVFDMRVFVNSTSVPESSTLLLFGTGLAMVGMGRYRRNP